METETETLKKAPKAKKEKSEKKRSPVLPILLVAILGAGGWYGWKALYHAMHYESTDNAQIEGSTVPVMARVAGYVQAVNVSDFQTVRAGDRLITIDSAEYEIAVRQAEADLAVAEADLDNAVSGKANTGQNRFVAVAGEELQQVRLNKAKLDLDRDRKLLAEGSITQKQFDDSQADYEAAVKQLRSNNEQVRLASVQTGGSEALIKKAKATIALRQTALDNARLRLTYAKIPAPASGRVGKVSAQPGQYVQPGQTLFTIVDTTHYWVVANFKETQIGNMKVGQPVELKIDGFPDQKLEGRIMSFSDATGARFALLPPDNSTGNFVKVTQRVPVRIEIENAKAVAHMLKAGLSVDVDARID